MCKQWLSLEYGSLSRDELEKRFEDTTITICMGLDYFDILDINHGWDALESDDAMKTVKNIMWHAFICIRKWTQAKRNDRKSFLRQELGAGGESNRASFGRDRRSLDSRSDEEKLSEEDDKITLCRRAGTPAKKSW
jgi:hypothetical protein